MSCSGEKILLRRNADKRVTYTPTGRNFSFAAFEAVFTARRGDVVLLQVTSSATANGSVFANVDDALVLTLEKADIALLDGGPDTDSEILSYDVVLIDGSGFENWTLGGPLVLLGLNDVGSCDTCGDVEVSINGDCVEVTIEGGNIGAGASVLLADLNQAVSDASESADEAAASAATAGSAGASAGAAAGAVAGDAAGSAAGAIAGQAAAESVVATKANIDLGNTPIIYVTAFGAVANLVVDNGAAINTAINFAAALGGGVVNIPPGVYGSSTTINLGAKHNVRLVGSGCTEGGRATTTIRWLGDVGGAILSIDDATVQTAGVGVIGIAFDGNNIANRALDTRGVVRSEFSDFRLFNCLETHWFMDIGASGLNSQGNFGAHVFIDAYTVAGSNGFVIGAGSATNDTCQSHFEDWQIQFLNGTGMDLGSCDTMVFENLKVYRFAGGAGKAMICRAGTNVSTFANWCQGNFFIRFEPRALDGSTTAFVDVQTGTREPDGNLFNMLDQSGPEYPTFAGNTVFNNIVESEKGYLLFKGVRRHATDGRVTFGANLDVPGAPASFVSTSRQAAFINPSAAANAKRWDVEVDANGFFIEGATNDAGDSSAIARVVTRSGAVVSGHQEWVGGSVARTQKGQGWMNLTPRDNLPSGGEAAGDVVFLSGAGANPAGLYLLYSGAWYRVDTTAA